MDFRISGLPLAPFLPLFELDADALRAQGVAELTVEEPHAWSCRVSLEDALPGERVLLLNYRHQPAEPPYAASGPIVVRRAVTATRSICNAVPDQQRRRLLSQVIGLLEPWRFEEGKPPVIRMRVEGDLDDQKSVRADVYLSSGALERGDIHISRVDARGAERLADDLQGAGRPPVHRRRDQRRQLFGRVPGVRAAGRGAHDVTTVVRIWRSRSW